MTPSETTQPDSRQVTQLVAEQAGRPNVRLTDAEQALLAHAYSFGLGARKQIKEASGSPRLKRQLRGYISSGDSAGELLMRSLRGLVVSITTEFANRRLGRRWAAQEIDDLIGDGVLIALECCAGYDESRGTTVAQWVATQLRQHLQNAEFNPGGGRTPPEWKRVTRAMNAIEQQTGQVLQDKKTYSTDQVLNLLIQTEEKRQVAKGLTPEEAVVKAHDSLSRQSVLRAMREISEISALASGVMSIDKTIGDDGDTLLDTLPDDVSAQHGFSLCSDADALHALMDVLPADAVSQATQRYGSAGDEVSYRRLADEAGLNWLDVRQAVERVKAAPGAPHAQFCAFYAHIEAQITVLPLLETSTQTELDPNSVRELLLAGR